jgi:4-amino-4-deoxy-L-arabinose transferase-like glycosyltransferase
MDAPTSVLILLTVATLAIGLDAVLVIGWHRRHQGKSFWHPLLTPWRGRFDSPCRRLVQVCAAVGSELRALWADLRRDELNLLRAVLLAACLWFSANLGYANLHADMVDPWQPWAWLACFALALAVLAPRVACRVAFNRTDLLVLVPVGIAFLVRVVQLDSILSGLHTDEVTTADFTLRYVFPGTGKTFFPLGSGPDSQPTLFYYIVRLSLELFGHNITALRLPSVLAGCLAILATYALIALWQDRRTALIAALLLSTYHYHVHWSRIALNNVWDTVWIPLILASLIWGWKSHWSGGALLAGLAIGLSQYFYVGSRIALVLVPYVLYQLWKQDHDLRKLLVHTFKLSAIAVIIALPLAMFTVANPQISLSRAQANYAWLSGAASLYGTSWWSFLRLGIEQAWLALAGLTVLSDRSGFYGPGIPFLVGLAGLLFLAGLIWAIHRRQHLPLVWILTTFFFASVLISGPPHTSHTIGAVPAIMWVLALLVSDLARLRSPRLAWFILVLLMLTDVVAYFSIIGTGGGDPYFTAPFPPSPFP